jgi:hypothetical protein
MFDIELRAERTRLLDEFHKAHQGVMQACLVRRGTALTSIACDPLVVLRAKWLKDAESRNKRNSFVCLGCDAEFYGHRKPAAFLIVTPFAAPAPTYAVVLGICRRCAEGDDAALQSASLVALRALYPDLRISAGPGHA